MMTSTEQIRVAINGYGVIGKRVADAVQAQDDMVVAGVADVVTDYRLQNIGRRGFSLFGATSEHAAAMQTAGLSVTGTLDRKSVV